MEENLKLADEFKIIIENENSMQEWASMIDFEKYGIPTWLHPEWSVTRNNLVLESITTWVKKMGPLTELVFSCTNFFRQMKKTKELDPLHHYQKTLRHFDFKKYLECVVDIHGLRKSLFQSQKTSSSHLTFHQRLL